MVGNHLIDCPNGATISLWVVTDRHGQGCDDNENTGPCCALEPDWVAGNFKMSQQAYAEEAVAKFGVTRSKDALMMVGLK